MKKSADEMTELSMQNYEKTPEAKDLLAKIKRAAENGFFHVEVPFSIRQNLALKIYLARLGFNTLLLQDENGRDTNKQIILWGGSKYLGREQVK